MELTESMLLAYKREITRILDAPELPSLGGRGLCGMLARTDAGRVAARYGECRDLLDMPLSYAVSYQLLTPVDYLHLGMGPSGVWTDKRYEYLWLIDLLTDSEFLELFPDALKA